MPEADLTDQQKMEVDEDEDDDSSSDDDLEFDEIEASEEDMAQITSLEAELEANPNLYDQHVQYIALLRKCKMKQRLKTARQSMHSSFPLAEPLWLEWLDDEIVAAKSAQQFQAVEELFEVAVQDYLSVNIWLKYLEYLSTSDSELKEGTKDGIAKFRNIAERALSACGLHLSEGSRLWKAYRQYETERASVTSDAKGDPQQPAKDLLYRQLQVPLVDLDETLQESKKSGEELPDNVKKGLVKAQDMLSARLPNEGAVAADKPADTELLAAYMAYIKLEQDAGDPNRVQCLYERAIAKFPVTHVLWLQYASYLEQHLKIPAVVNKVYARAVRNCPWVGDVWCRALRAMERGGAPDAEHEALYKAALSAGMASAEEYLGVALARLDALRRRGPAAIEQLRATFAAATELMQTYFPDYVDRSLRLPSYWAACELELANNVAGAREVWEATVKSPLGGYVETIAAYVSMEVAAKNLRQARTLYKRFYNRHLQEGGALTLCEAWLRFEREHGSAEDYFQAFVKVEPLLSQAASAAAAAANPELAADVKAAAETVPKAKLSKEDMKRLRQQKDPNFKGAQAEGDRPPRAAPKRKKGLGFKEPQGDAKRTKTDVAAETAPPKPQAFASTGPEDGTTTLPAKQLSWQSEDVGSMGPPPPRTTKPAAQADGPAAGPPASQSTQRHDAPQVADHQRVAYVRGIRSEAGKADVEALMAPCGGIVEVRMPERSGSQAHRGFAYVTFESAGGLRKALQLDGSQLQGQAITVAVSHQAVQEDQRVAFVLNINPATEAPALEALLAPCGTIKSTRMPLDFNSGQRRGFAYVEFETSAALQKAVDMNGVTLDDNILKISVATQRDGGGGRRGRGPPRGRGGPPRDGGHGGGYAEGHGRGGFADSGRGRGGYGSGGRGRGGRGHGMANGRGHGDAGDEFEAQQAPSHRPHLDMSPGATAFQPRAVASRGGGRGGAPKSNTEFRDMFLKK